MCSSDLKEGAANEPSEDGHDFDYFEFHVSTRVKFTLQLYGSNECKASCTIG